MIVLYCFVPERGKGHIVPQWVCRIFQSICKHFQRLRLRTRCYFLPNCNLSKPVKPRRRKCICHNNASRNTRNAFRDSNGDDVPVRRIVCDYRASQNKPLPPHRPLRNSNRIRRSLGLCWHTHTWYLKTTRRLDNLCGEKKPLPLTGVTAPAGLQSNSGSLTSF